MATPPSITAGVFLSFLGIIGYALNSIYFHCLATHFPTFRVVGSKFDVASGPIFLVDGRVELASSLNAALVCKIGIVGLMPKSRCITD